MSDTTLHSTPPSGPREPVAGVEVHTTTLANGLTLVGERNPRAQSVAAGYFVNTGARDETEEVAGVSHFLEHMLFKGTERRSAEAINLEFDELGGRYNAYTSEDRTVYYGAVLPERGAELLDLLTDMMRPALRQTDFDVEKKVILEEIAMYRDRPNARVLEEAARRFHRAHPAGNSVLGSVDSIGALRREQMLAYFEARYAADNLTLVLTGAFDWEAVVEQIETATRAWRGSGSDRNHPVPDPARGREGLRDAGLTRHHLAVFAPGVTAQDPRRYAAAILANCIGDAGSSRLHWALVDSGMVDTAWFGHDAGDRVGAFLGYVSTAPERAARVEARLDEVFAEVETGGLEAGEFARAQAKLATSVTLRAETPLGRLMSLGPGLLYTGRYHSLQEIVDGIRGASLDEANALLGERPLQRRYALALGPDAA